MVGLEYLVTYVKSRADKVKKFDWTHLIPRFRVDRYIHGVVEEDLPWPWVLGIEPTWPWRREGLGVGIGLGWVDFWFGWSRYEGDLHTLGCVHSTPMRLEPADS